VFELRQKIEELTQLLTEEVMAREESEKALREDIESLSSQLEWIKEKFLPLMNPPVRPPPLPEDDD